MPCASDETLNDMGKTDWYIATTKEINISTNWELLGCILQINQTSNSLINGNQYMEEIYDIPATSALVSHIKNMSMGGLALQLHSMSNSEASKSEHLSRVQKAALGSHNEVYWCQT